MRSKNIAVIVAERAATAARRFATPVTPAAAVRLALVIPLAVGVGAGWIVRSEVRQLRTENAALMAANESYREATVQLSAQIAALQAAVDEIGELAAVDPAVNRAMNRLPAGVWARAMGGGTAADMAAPVIATSKKEASEAFAVFTNILSVIENRLEALRSGVERRHALAAATPSIWPVPGWLSSSFGTRQDPFTGQTSFHPGLDISAHRGEAVRATADGVVSHAGFAGNYGNLVVLEHGFGISTKYGHLSKFAVAAGQVVRRGDVIGYVGSTGRSTSPHLHYELWVNGRLANPLRLLGPRRAVSP